MKEKISVIIPTYKRPKKLKRALRSVLNQTYENYEVIVVNDHKIETKVQNIIEEYNDGRIKYFRNQRKKGANGARNTGMLKSKGKYITFLDDDDEFKNRRLEKLKNFFKENNYDCAVTGYYLRIDDKLLKKPHPKYKITLKNYFLGKINLGFGSNMAINKDNISVNNLLWDENLNRHQDIDLFIRLLSKKSIGYLSERLVVVNGHNGRPNPNKMEIAKKRLLWKIKNYYSIDINKNILKHYFSNQYRHLALLYGRNNNYRKMFIYLGKSLKSKILSPIKYIRFIFVLLGNYSSFDMNKYWNILKNKIK